MEYRTYGVSKRDREPLLAFLVNGLKSEGCRILYQSPADQAPFRVTFESAEGERMGIVCYAFFANSKTTRNRPEDEYRFQIKYGTRDGSLHSLWQDPFGLYTTLFLGINPDEGFFVAADPVLHNPTRFYISLEFKRAHVKEIVERGWYAWERRSRREEPIEVLVGGTVGSLTRLVRFEREALGEDQGHRQLLAERSLKRGPAAGIAIAVPGASSWPRESRLHALAREFELDESEVLDLIANARRLKMAVRGWVAEEHLVRQLRRVPGVTDCVRLDEEGGPDIRLRYHGSRPVTVECKNALRQLPAKGLARVDFQRTRASKADPCSRYYCPDDFDVLAACLHSVREQWEFRYAITGSLTPHSRCPGKLANAVVVDDGWASNPAEVLQTVGT